MKSLFTPGSNRKKPVLLLLHGTGGDERSLLSLASAIDSEAAVLSVRGNVLEHGMPRFFKRLSEGVFDEEDLVLRTEELYHFLGEAASRYAFDRNRIVAIGYSNGANIAASLLYHFKDSLSGAILHHPMVPRRGLELPDLSGKEVFIGAGTNDPISPVEEAKELQTALEAANAAVSIYWGHSGHQLTAPEVQAAKEWYQKRY